MPGLGYASANVKMLAIMDDRFEQYYYIFNTTNCEATDNQPGVDFKLEFI